MKKLLCLFLCCVAVLSLTACTDTQPTDGPSDPTPAQTYLTGTWTLVSAFSEDDLEETSPLNLHSTISFTNNPAGCVADFYFDDVLYEDDFSINEAGLVVKITDPQTDPVPDPALLANASWYGILLDVPADPSVTEEVYRIFLKDQNTLCLYYTADIAVEPYQTSYVYTYTRLEEDPE